MPSGFLTAGLLPIMISGSCTICVNAVITIKLLGVCEMSFSFVFLDPLLFVKVPSGKHWEEKLNIALLKD